MRTKLVAKPGSLTETVRHKLNEIDATCFEGEELYPKDDAYWWVVEDEEGVCAFAGLRPCKTPGYEGKGFLCRAGVLKRAEGNGLQRKLIKTRIAMARKIGLKEVITYTHPLNFVSAANLIRAGLHFDAPEERWAGSHMMYFHLVLKKDEPVVEVQSEEASTEPLVVEPNVPPAAELEEAA